MNSNKNIFLIALIVILLGGALYFAITRSDNSNITHETPVVPETPNQPNGSNNPNQPNNPASSMIIVDSPKEGMQVDATNGFTVTGKAVGSWYFEANAPVTVYSKEGKPLKKTYMEAQGEWMTTSFVPFKGTIAPFVTGGATEGYILFENSNPSDNEGLRLSLKVNVTFVSQETQTIKVYFGNTKSNPNAADCSKVFSVQRVVPKASSIGTLAIETLIQGPTNGETALGYTSAFGVGGAKLKSLTIKNDVATADFSYLPSGGSCLMGEARAQIEQTLKQFSTIKTVKILLNGNESEALQP